MLKNRFNSIDYKNVLSALFLGLVNALILTSIYISLPNTEKYLPRNRFDLVTKESQYQKQDAIIELIVSKDKEKSKEEIQTTKNIVFKRLANFGVEEIRISDYKGAVEIPTPDDQIDSNHKKAYIKVQYNTTKDNLSVQTLVSNRAYLRLYTVSDKQDTKPTKYTRHFFRNVHITKLRDSQDTFTYFMMFKTWPNSYSDFRNFLNKNANKEIIIGIDSIQIPGTVPAPNTNSPFAVPVSQEEEQAKIFDSLLNSGVIPAEMKVMGIEDAKVNTEDTRYVESFLAIAAGFIAVFAFIVLSGRKSMENNIVFITTVAIIFPMWLAALKVFAVPVDLFLITFEGFILLIMIKTITLKQDIAKFTIPLMALAFTIMLGTTYGYTKIVAKDLLYLTLATGLVLPIAMLYLNNMRKYLKK